MKILKFSASWCGPCKQIAAVLARIDTPCPVDEIDVDADNARAVEYGIRGVPTLILVDDAGKEISRQVGSKTEAELRNWFTTFPA